MDKLFEGETITEGDLSDGSGVPNSVFKKLIPYVNFRNYVADLPDQVFHNYTYNDPSRTSASIIMIKPFKYTIFAAAATDITAGLQEVNIDPAVSDPDLEEGQSYRPMFVTWGWIEDNVLSRFFSSIGRDTENNLKTIGTFRSIEHQYNADGTEVKTIFEPGESTTSPTEEQKEFLYTGNFPQSTKMRRSKKMLTADTSKWIIFNGDVVSELMRENVGGPEGELVQIQANVKIFSPKSTSNQGGDIGGKRNEGLCKEDEGFIRNVYFNVNWLSRIMSESSNIQDAVTSVWDEFAATYGGVHRFRIEIEDDGNQVVIRDMGYQGMTIKDLIASVSENKTKKDGSIGDMNRLFEFPTWEMGSIVKSQNINAKLPSRMQLAAMYGSNNSSGVMSESTGGDYDTLSALAWGRLNKPKLPEDANEETLEGWKRAHYEDLLAGKWDSPNLHNRSFGVSDASPKKNIYVGDGTGNQQPINNGTVVYSSIFNEIDASQTKEVLRRVKNKKEALTKETFSADEGGRPKTFWEGIAGTWAGKVGGAGVVKTADFLGIIDEEDILKLNLPDLKAAEAKWQTFNPTSPDNVYGMYIQSFKDSNPYKISVLKSAAKSPIPGIFGAWFSAYNTAKMVENTAIYSMKLGGEFLHAMKQHSKGDSTGIGNNTDPIVPIEFEMDIDGTGGIFPGNAFQSSYLPEEYKKQTCFQVVGASHKIDTTGWTTTLKGQIRVAMRDLEAEKIKKSKVSAAATHMGDMTDAEKEAHLNTQIEGKTPEPETLLNTASMKAEMAKLQKSLGYSPPVVTPKGFDEYGGVAGYIKERGLAPSLMVEPMKSMGFEESGAILQWMDANGIEPGKTVPDDFMEALEEHIYQGGNPYGVVDWDGAVNNWSQTVAESVNTAPAWTTAATMGSANRMFRRSGGQAGETFEWNGNLYAAW